MEISYYILALVLLGGGFLYAFMGVAKEGFRRKYFAVGAIIQLIIFVYYLVKGIRSGDKFDFAFAALFLVALLITYSNYKKSKVGNETNS